MACQDKAIEKIIYPLQPLTTREQKNVQVQLKTVISSAV